MTASSPFLDRDSLVGFIDAHLERCNLDELHVVAAVMRRLEVARATCGPVDREARDWHAGAAADLLDAAIYYLATQLSIESRRKESPR